MLIREVASRQGGYVTVTQLVDRGLTRSAIQNLIVRGFLIRVFHGVYAVGHEPTASPARAHAPLLAVGERSALAGWSAMNAYTNATRWVEPFTVITPLRSSPLGVRVLHTNRLRASDIHTLHGLAAVSPALALLHVAGDLTPGSLIRQIDDFRIRRDLTRGDLRDAMARFPRAAAPLRRVVDGLAPEPTRSAWEQEWPAFAARFELRPYEMNVHVLNVRVDVLFPGRLVTMLDGWHLHGSRHAFEHDREEVAEIMAVTGLPVLRVTYRQFHDDPVRLANRIQAILARESR